MCKTVKQKVKPEKSTHKNARPYKREIKHKSKKYEEYV